MIVRYFLSLVMIGMGYMLIRESKKLSSNRDLISRTIEAAGYIICCQLFLLLFEDILHGYFKWEYVSTFYWIIFIATILIILFCIVFIKADLHTNARFLIYSCSLEQIINTIESIFKKNDISFDKKDFFGWVSEGIQYTILDSEGEILLYESKNGDCYKIDIKKFRKLKNKKLITDIDTASEELRDKAIVDKVKQKEKKHGLIMMLVGIIFAVAYICIGIFYR